MLWHLAPVMIYRHLSTILPCPIRVLKIFDIVAHRQHHLVRHKPLVHQIQHQKLRHLPHDNPRLFEFIGTLQYLTGTNTVGFGLIGFDICHRAGFISPGMINEKFRIDTE